MNPRANFESASQLVHKTACRWSHESQLEVSALCHMASKALLTLLNKTEMLFSRRLTLRGRELRLEPASPKRTVVALLGLSRLASSGQRQPFDLTSIETAVFQDKRWIKGIGDLGILVQFAAQYSPDRLASLADDFDFTRALEIFPDGREAYTTGLSCFLAGISQAKLFCPNALPDLTDVAVETYRLLENNQGASGTFAHVGLPGMLQQAFSNRFGTIGDQVHAIYALSTFARAFEVEEPLADALNCANAIRALQGERGQWWFLYDNRSSRVVNRYPVCSIYQNGMAPLALRALAEATGQNFDDAIWSGLSWTAGANELGVDLCDEQHGIIWDSIEARSRIANFCEHALNFIQNSGKSYDDNLMIRFEARPDHFGWLLYALTGFEAKAMTVKAASAG